jgi:hypothetical protein
MEPGQSDKLFLILTGFLLAVMGTVEVLSSLQENQTFDEAVHLVSGYSYLSTGDYRLNPEHPPLAKLLAALPLLAVKPHLNRNNQAWKDGDAFALGSQFLYENRTPADTLLLLGRLPTIAATLVLGAVLAFWVRRNFGPAPALLTLFLYTLDPNIIAHGRYITNDMLVTLFVFLSCAEWANYLETRRWRHLAGAGVATGLAFATKFSALFLLLVLPLMGLIHWLQQRKTLPPRRRTVVLIPLFFVAFLIFAAAYWRESVRMFRGHPDPLVNYVDDSTYGGMALRWLGEEFQLPAHNLLVGLDSYLKHAELGHPAYVLGQHSETGFWYYFPVAFAVKTPTAVLLLFLLCVAGALRLAAKWPPRRLVADLRRLPFRWIVVAVPPIVYFVLSMTSRIDIGVRHLLPIYPFLFALVSAFVFRLPGKAMLVIVTLAVSVEIFESARIYPDYLAFFNSLVGGSTQGPRYLVDSNLDWGQDVKKLKKYMDAHGLQQVCLAYFGEANVAYYGIRELYVPHTNDIEGRKNLDCIVAVSATVLEDVYVDKGSYAWLRRLAPIDRVGYSIYIYDLRKKRSGG